MPIPVKSTADFFVRNGAGAQSDAIVVARPDGQFFVGSTDATSGLGVFSARYPADVSGTIFRTLANNAAIDEQQLGREPINGIPKAALI